MNREEALLKPAIAYLVTNKMNGKRYLGITCQDIKRRMSQHFCHAMYPKNQGKFYRAIRKYGRDSFQYEVVAYFPTARVAIKEEIKLISEIKPEYNSTLGGEGRLGGHITEAGRRAISLAQKGFARNLGNKMSEDSKALLREIGLRPESKARWERYRSLGPKASSRPVVCLDDGLIYDSASAAARFYGVRKSTVIEVCLKKPYRKTAGGFRFAYEAEI